QCVRGRPESVETRRHPTQTPSSSVPSNLQPHTPHPSHTSRRPPRTCPLPLLFPGAPRPRHRSSPLVLPLFVPVPATPVAPALELTAGNTSDTSIAAQASRQHTVRAGETAYDIARRYRVSTQALLS